MALPFVFIVLGHLFPAGLTALATMLSFLSTITSWFAGLGVFSTTFLLASVSILLAIWSKYWTQFLKPRLFSWLLHHGSIVSPSEERYRRDFSSLKMRRYREKDNHSHGISAGRRTVAKRFMTDYAVKVGLAPFQVQQSHNDQKHGVAGCRTFFWSKDMTMDYNFSTPGKHDLILMTDVDYYIDMPWFLAWNAKPIMMYTMVPSTLAHSTGETSHCFHADNTIEYRISGGGCYQHRLWDYSADNVTSTWTVLGLPIITTTYHIERRNIDDHHMIILFTPIRYWYGPYAWLATFLDGYRLQRLNVVDGEFTRLRVQEKDQLYMCTGLVGSYACAKVPIEQDDALAIAARIMKNDITPPTVQSYIGTDAAFKTPAVVITAYHRHHTGFKAPVVYPVHYGVKDYVYKPEVFYEHSKSSLIGFMSPIIDACYAPTDSKENEEVCIEERITKILSDVDLSDQYREFALEFIRFLVPDAARGSVVPLTLDDVYERQNRPSQRRLIDEGSFYGPHMDKFRKVNPFQKKEAYAEPKPARNISTINSRDKIDYSCFIYAAAEVFKQNAPWYAFGHTPKEIATRVADICKNAQKHAVNSDLSRFDGRLALAFRIVEEMFLLRLFPVHLHDQIIELHNSQFGLRGRGKHGTEYFTGYSRLSGSPETALFNSLANAFMVYVTKRVCGLKPQRAWDTMGIYGGDDGLTADLDVETYTKVCSNLGMKTTAESVPKGKLGIKFLARIYSPEVWSGSLDSCADFQRQLSKFHATPHLPSTVSAIEKLIEKSRGFYLSDPNTPVLGALARKVLDLTTCDGWSDDCTRVVALPVGGDGILIQTGTAAELAAQSVTNITISKEIRNYASFAPFDEQYPNTNETQWMRDCFEKQVPTFSFDRFETHLNQARDLETLLKFPLCAEPVRPVVTAPVVVQEEIIEPVIPAPPVSPPAAPVGQAKGEDPHRTHKWKDSATCYACHPDLHREKKRNKGKDADASTRHPPRPPRPLPKSGPHGVGRDPQPSQPSVSGATLPARPNGLGRRSVAPRTGGGTCRRAPGAGPQTQRRGPGRDKRTGGEDGTRAPAAKPVRPNGLSGPAAPKGDAPRECAAPPRTYAEVVRSKPCPNGKGPKLH